MAANQERFDFQVADCEHELRVVRFQGHEEISSLFHFELELASEEQEIDFSSVVGRAASLMIYSEGEPRYLNGFISRFVQAAHGVRFSTYHAVVVPKLWYLNHRHNCRIFQQQSAADIVEKILGEANFSGDEYRIDLQNELPVREYCVQYRESDLNFVSRLMEEEGVSYYFEHDEEKHILVFIDHSTAFPTIGADAVIYHEKWEGSVATEHIDQFHYAEEVTPDRVALQDYNFKKPGMRLSAEQSGLECENREIYDYPGIFDEPSVATKRSKIRLEEVQNVSKEGRGRSNVALLISGHHFQLNQYPRDEYNKKYLLTAVTHEGAQPQVLEEGASIEGSKYLNQFHCIPLGHPFRPTRKSPCPTIEGTQTAFVVGPEGEEIYTDEYGRVKVQFHWDREGNKDENSSCWIRVSQLWAGAGWGGIFLPRIGHEVIVDFLEGDPDRPIVTGRVYHGTNRPPYPLPAEKSKSTIKSNSSKGGGGYNEIRLEDKQGEEQIYIHAQRNKAIRVNHKRHEWVGSDRHLEVRQNQFEHVEEDKHSTVSGDLFQQVVGDLNSAIESNRVEKIGGSEHHEVGLDRMEKVAGADHLQIGESSSLKVGNKYSVEVGQEGHYMAGKRIALSAGKEVHVKGGMSLVLEAGVEITIKAGGSFITVGPSGVSLSGAAIQLNGGGSPGSGSGCSPNGPAPVAAPQPPELPVGVASGGVDRGGRHRARPIKPLHYGPQAQAIKRGQKEGSSFVQYGASCQKEKVVDEPLATKG
jgi:type VI secretion system secreted protein VgrG